MYLVGAQFAFLRSPDSGTTERRTALWVPEAGFDAGAAARHAVLASLVRPLRFPGIQRDSFPRFNRWGASPLPKQHQTTPIESFDDDLQEIAAILAAGYLRCREVEQREPRLDNAVPSSPHGRAVNAAEKGE
jgi:hypothetical protein